MSDSDRVLGTSEVETLIALARELPDRFPEIVNDAGEAAPADIEFGFLDSRLALFQIRPFLESRRARSSTYLATLDAGLRDTAGITVDLRATPGKAP